MIISDWDFSKKLVDIDWESAMIGLSGGADSLCLILLLNEYAKKNNKKIYAGIVDHKLRPESSIEILPIIEILKKNDIPYKILVWDHDKDIGGNIERKAREARYDLLYKLCKDMKSDVLMTAHHALDQWETFFMRLSRGSSVKGLSSIKYLSKYRDIRLLRPLLDFSPYDIRDTLENRFNIKNYVKDPMNEQIEFERVRWRNSYKDLSNQYHLDIKNINKSIGRIQRANDCLSEISINLSEKIFDGEYIDIKKFRDLHIELKIRILDILVSKFSSKHQIISNSLLEKISDEIIKKDFIATNFAGVVLRRDRTKNIKIYKENREG